MITRISIALISVCISGSILAQQTVQVDEQVGLELRKVTCSSTAMTTLFCIHDDEDDAVKAYYQCGLDQFHLLELNQAGTRHISFIMDGETYHADPNRMFSERGRRNTLKYYGRHSSSAELHLQCIAESVLSNLKKQSTDRRIVALHNNTEGALTIHSFDEPGTSAHIHVNPNQDPDDFIIVTEILDFLFLADRGYNVTLQSREVEDDGSLSVWCAKNGYRYANIEAQEGHVDQQAEMIQAIQEMYEAIPNGMREFPADWAIR
ncbi:MAG: hypothetical protein ACKOZY_07145 [Flavobacteriales bacterium]